MSADPDGRGMRLLHVGSGYRPLRWGGLVAYVEDLMAEQARAGHRLSYFFTGRYFRWPRGPRLKRWRRGEVEMLELVNSPLHDHGRQPRRELSDPAVEALFSQVVSETDPDVIHVQELAGLPSSLLEIARESRARVVMTLQDYFPLCSTFKLLDADGEVCLRREIGADCVASVRAEGRPANLLYEGSLRHALMRRPILSAIGEGRRDALVERLSHSPLTRPRSEPEVLDPQTFQRRREINLERLNRADRLVAMSSRVAEIYSELGVDDAVLITMRLTLGHVARLTPRVPSGASPVVFATLGGGESPAKGSRLVARAVRLLAAEVEPESFRLLIFGQCEPELAAAVAGIESVELRGTYGSRELDRMLDEVDVGLMPSIWEEAYGYAGIEFIAKGIPVIANRIGGMVDYVREAETGWFNRSNSARGLAEVMTGLAREPERVAAVAATTRDARPELVETMAAHAAAVERLYRDLLAA